MMTILGEKTSLITWFFWFFGYMYCFHLDFTIGPQFWQGPSSPSL
jgi:hypothetical protein